MYNMFIQICSLFLIMILGLFLKKKKYLSENTLNELSKIMAVIVLPCLIIVSMQSKFDKKIFYNSLTLLGFGILYYLFIFIFSNFISKLFKINNKNIYIFLSIFANVGYIAYPLIDSILGQRGIFYAAVYNISHGLFLWTLGVSLLNHEKKINLKLIFNPGLLSLIFAFLMFSFSIKIYFPIINSMKMIGNLATPLSMLIIGASLSEIKLNDFFNKEIWILISFKLFIIPIFLIFLLRNIEMEKILKEIIIIISAMPCAANSVILSRRYNTNYEFASRAVSVSTLLSIINLSIILFLTEKFIF